MDSKNRCHSLWQTLAPRIMPGDIEQSNSLLYWRTLILTVVLCSGVLMGVLVLVPVTILAIKENLYFLLYSDFIMLGICFALLFLPGLRFIFRAMTALTLVYFIGILVIVNVGVTLGGPAWLFGFAVLSGVFFGSRAALIALTINTVTMTVIGVCLAGKPWGIASPPFYSNELIVVAVSNFLFLNALVSISVSVLVKGLVRANEKEHQLALSLKKKQEMLAGEIRERELADAARVESEERYRNILRNIEDGYFEVDLEGNLTFFNASMSNMLGYSRKELLGMNNRIFMDKTNAREIFRAFNRTFRTGVPMRSLDWQLIRKDGTQCAVEVVGSLISDAEDTPLGFRGIARDVSHRRAMEASLRQSQKMESIGTLAAGIAHDFNNVLYIIVGNADLAIEDIPKHAPVRIYLQQIKAASLRAAGVVRQLLNFSRDTEQKLVPLDLGEIVREELAFLRSSFPSFIDIRFEMPGASIYVLGDRVQINQLLINICTNAAQAMEKKGGCIFLKLSCIRAEPSVSVEEKELEPGVYACLSIEDNGPGIPPELIDKIFDPYFTTKEVGKGSGMGLSVVHGIVKTHSGVIEVESLPGEGANFRILIPLTFEKPVRNVQESPPENRLPKGSESILFVDDEPVVLETTRKILTRLGYTVRAISDPSQALAVFKSHRDSFDLVITDMTMPGMKGEDLVTAILGIRRDIPVIICTGHGDALDEDRALSLGASGFMMKPVSMHTLATHIRNILDQG